MPGCNQTIKITGGPGATSVQSVTYNPATHTITVTKANGSTSQLHLVDMHLTDVKSDAKGMITFTISDGMGRGATTKEIKFDGSRWINVQSNYTETDTAKDAYIKNKPNQLVRFLNLDMAKHKLTWKDELMNPHEIDISAFAGCPHVVSGFVDPTKKELILVTQHYGKDENAEKPL